MAADLAGLVGIGPFVELDFVRGERYFFILRFNDD
jgi:hypothetical protein